MSHKNCIQIILSNPLVFCKSSPRGGSNIALITVQYQQKTLPAVLIQIPTWGTLKTPSDSFIQMVMFVIMFVYLWITHSQICFGALPPEKTVFLQVPVYSNLRQAFRIRASVKTERGREKKWYMNRGCIHYEMFCIGSKRQQVLTYSATVGGSKYCSARWMRVKQSLGLISWVGGKKGNTFNYTHT